MLRSWLATPIRTLDQALEGLAGELDARSELEARRARIAQRLASDELAEERDAAEALAKVEKKLASKGTKAANLKALERLAKQYPGTRSAALAEHWLRLSEVRIEAGQ
jgi:TolA-binding protein